jgi:hypothetical protein
MLNWLWTHCRAYKTMYPAGVPKSHEDHFTGKEYEDGAAGSAHDYSMGHNPDEKEFAEEDEHFGKTADEDDTHLKDTSEPEEPEHEEVEEDPFKEEDFEVGGKHYVPPTEDAHHDPTADGV